MPDAKGFGGRRRPRSRDSVSLGEIVDGLLREQVFSRGMPVAQLASRWPEIRSIERLWVEGPPSDAQLLAGWLRSRLRRDVALTRSSAENTASIRVDGEPVQAPLGKALSASDLLSAELDTLARDPIYEAAVKATTA